MIGVWIVIGILVLTAFAVVGIYNSLVVLRNRTDNAWSQIDVQLKRRHDLIPNLVETAKGYMQHERGTFESVTEARSRAMGARSVGEASKAEGALTEALSKFMLVVENYPDLKANQNFLQLQSQLEGTENRISVARRDYIAAVQRYNTEIRTFPGRIWHTVMYSDMPIHETFTASEGAEKAPAVKF